MSVRPEPPYKEAVDAAFRKASEKAFRVAKQTRTPLILWKNNKVLELPLDDFSQYPTSEQIDAWVEKTGWK